jgi:hypothetical protein
MEDTKERTPNSLIAWPLARPRPNDPAGCVTDTHRKTFVMIDQTAVRQFLRAALPTGVPTDSFLPIWTDTRHYTWRCDTVDQALDVLRDHHHVNLYIGNLVRRSLPHGRRGTSADVTHVFALKIDIDIADGQHTGSNLAPDLEAALAVVENFSPILHSALVFTGGGIQAWWFLELTDDLARAADLSARLTRFFQERSPYKVDATHDLARVFRLPGSINHKTGSPRPTQLLALDPTVRYALADIEATLPIVQPKTTAPRGPSASAREIQQMLRRIPGTGLDYHDEWLPILAAVKYELGDDGFALVEEWTGQYSKPRELREKWNSFKGTEHPVTIGTIRHIARQYMPLPSLGGRTVCSQFLQPADLISHHKLLVLVSDRGTGKTEAMALASKGKRVLIVGHRRALLRNLAHRFGEDVDYYEDVEDLSTSRRLAITYNSLRRLLRLKGCPRFDVIILDEFEQGHNHLTADNFEGDRFQSLEVLREVLKASGRIMAADADTTPTGVAWLRELAGVEEADVVVNTYHQSPLTARVVPRYDQWVKVIEDSLHEGKRWQVNTNSCSKALDLERYMQGRFPDKRIMCINGEVANPEAQAILMTTGCTGFATVDLLITTPTVSTGVSIDVPFDGVAGYFERNITTATDAAQQLARVRTVTGGEILLCFGRERTEWREEDPEVLRANPLALALKQGLRVVGWGGIREEEQFYLRLWSDYQAARNASLNSFTAHLFSLLRREGVRIERTEAMEAPAIREAIKAVHRERMEEQATAILEARDITPLEAEHLSANPISATDRAELSRFRMVKLYGQPPTEELIAEHTHNHLAERMLNLRNMLRPDIAEAVDRTELTQPVPHRGYHTLRAQVRWEVIEASGIGRDLQGTLNREAFCAWLKEHGERVSRVLGLQVNRLLAAGQESQILSSILGQVGLKLTGQRPKGKPRVYRINQDRFKFVMDLVTSHLAAREPAAWQPRGVTWETGAPEVATPAIFSLNKEVSRVATPGGMASPSHRGSPQVPTTYAESAGA